LQRGQRAPLRPRPGERDHGAADRALAAPREAAHRPGAPADALSAGALSRLDLPRARCRLHRVRAAGNASRTAASAARRARRDRLRRARQRGLLRPSRLPRGRFSAAHRVEGRRAEPRPVEQDVRRPRRKRALARLEQPAAAARYGGAHLAAHALGAGSRGRRHRLWPASGDDHDRARAWRRAPHALPRSACAAARMSAALDFRHLAWLALSMALVTLPHIERLPAWLTALAAFPIGWRLYLGWIGGRLPRKWALLVIVTGASAGIYFSYGTLFGRDAGVALLVVMLTLKLLEMASLRDAMIVIFLSFFVVLTNFLYSQ